MGHHEHPQKGRALLSRLCYPALELPGPTGRPSAGSRLEPGSGRELSSPCGAGGPHPQEAMDFIFIFSVCSIKLGKAAHAELDQRTRPGKARSARGAQLEITGPGAAENVSGRTRSTSPSGGLEPTHVGSSSRLPHPPFLYLSISLFPFNFLFPFSIFPFHFPFSLCAFIFHFNLVFLFPSFLPFFPPPALLFSALQHRVSPQACPCHLPSPCQGDLPVPEAAPAEGQGKGGDGGTRVGNTGLRGRDIWDRQGEPGPWEGHGWRTGQAARGRGRLGTGASRGGWHSQMCAQGVAWAQPDVRGRGWALGTCSTAGRALGTGCGGEGVTAGPGRVAPVTWVTPGRRCHRGRGEGDPGGDPGEGVARSRAPRARPAPAGTGRGAGGRLGPAGGGAGRR